MIPALFLSVLLAFLLSEASPTDPVEGILHSERGDKIQNNSPASEAQQYQMLRHKFGLDLPTFYFSVSSASQSDTLYKVYKSTHRNALARLSDQYGNWTFISNYYRSLCQLEYLLNTTPPDSQNSNELISAKQNLQALFSAWKKEEINYQFTALEKDLSPLPNLYKPLKAAEKEYGKVLTQASPSNKYLPCLHWYGFRNRFHHWLVNLCRGNFGESFVERRPVANILRECIPWTLLLNGISIVLAFLIAIPTGVFLAGKRKKYGNNIISIVLFLLYSLPVFWMATLLIIFFGGGDFLNWFPSSGINDLGNEAPWLNKILNIAWHLVLPVFCMTYGSFAFISKQMQSAMEFTQKQDYIKTAKAKGLGPGSITWKHGFKNALLPMITLSASILPALISGSVVVESIFSYPGIGQKGYNAVLNQDYPVIFSLLILTAVLTMFGNLIADILYVISNPRINFKQRTTLE